RTLDPNPETRRRASGVADPRRGAQRRDATISANDKRVLAEGDHAFVEKRRGWDSNPRVGEPTTSFRD
ncbi:MAG: hypothetical protein RL136_2571, partial [Planctomycetota bacterium]